MEIVSVRKREDKPLPHEKFHYTMACYTFHLAVGATIKGTAIKSGTIDQRVFSIY